MIGAGQRLYNTRVTKSLSIDDIALATKIRPSFLAAIERGEYDKLPSSAYAQGFVRNYASYLGLPQREILALFRREFDEKKNIKVLPDSMTNSNQGIIPRIYFQQSFMILVLCLVVMGGYLGFQYRSMLIAPSLVIKSPSANMKVDNNNVTVTGKSDPNATVLVNNEPVTLDSEGEFRKTLSLFPGKSSIIIKAKNRFGKENIAKRDVIVED